MRVVQNRYTMVCPPVWEIIHELYPFPEASGSSPLAGGFTEMCLIVLGYLK